MFLSLKVLIYLEILYLAAILSFKFSLNETTRRLITPGDIAVLLLVPMVGLFGGNKTVFYIFVFLIPLMSVGNLDRLARHYLLTLLVIPELSEPYLLGDVYLGSLNSIIFLNAGALLCLGLTRTKSRNQIASLDVALWLFFFVMLFISAKGSTLGGVTRGVTLAFFLVVPPYYVISRAITSSESAFNSALHFVFGCFCNAVIALFECVRRWPLYETFYQGLHVDVIGLSATLSIRAGLLRANGAVFNYETLGLITGLSILLLIANRMRFGTVGRWFVGAILVLGCFTSQARSAWVATIIALLCYYIYTRQWKMATGIVAVCAAAAVVITTFLPSQGLASAVVGTSGHGQESIQYRTRLFSRGLDEIGRHPFTGQSIEQLQLSMSDLRQGEHIIDFVNTHLLAALVGGFGLVGLWFVAWLVPLVVASNARRRIGLQLLPQVAVPMCMTIACFVMLTFSSPVDRTIPLVVICLGFVSVAVRFTKRSAVPRIGQRV